MASFGSEHESAIPTPPSEAAPSSQGSRVGEAQTSLPRPNIASRSLKGGDLYVHTSGHAPSGTQSPNTPANTPAAPGRRLRRPTEIGSGSVPGTPLTASVPRRRRPKDRHLASLEAIRDFLRERSSYDVLPVSFRVVVLDTKLVVKPALDVLWQAGIISAPLWHSTVPPPLERNGEQEANGDQAPSQTNSAEPVLPRQQSAEASKEGSQLSSTADLPSSKIKPGFAGMLTVNDIIHLIQYYYKFHASYDIAAKDVEHFRLESLRDIEQALGVPQPPLLSIDPIRPLYQACRLLVKTHARRLPLLDYDETTGAETVVSVLTQYRVLKFIAMNCRETAGLHRSLQSCRIGTYTDNVSIATATLDTTVFDVVHIFSELGISAVPIVDDDGFVVDMYETVDVITLVRTGAYTVLDMTIRQALDRRPKDFPGVYTCSPQDSLANIFALLRKVRFHRLLILEPEDASLPTPGAGDTSDEAQQAQEDFAASAELASATVTTPLAATMNKPLELPEDIATGGSSRTSSGSKVSEKVPQGRTIEQELEAGLRTRKRGRLAGIVCLSDILRYIVGADEKDLGSALRQATA
ncbi:unnamed protein product [Tilletia controversa]|uniref:CBS domain-containing protein n=3 Tax=Tilletia TaxID=13289 RepID=A0A8X7MUP6_9BASI|nr:hypothetical protein CF336_g2933 [Tilletia laevis]KAE8201285.1 hypothetical protein CF328_g2719 [Tilletia controversa]KAE8262708.1 hypothetical protein A4X03_0g2242 [Tilletia caries]KAE8205474.1 hypothetical protein CF335_g2282 [Tilletia laevis]KAE8249253.1 hypothetical protein A4X06_0g3321 [Tilletia controversa]